MASGSGRRTPGTWMATVTTTWSSGPGSTIYLYSGADGTPLGAITGQVMGETLGFDATGMGDVDGDGIPDILVTSAWSAIVGTRSGRVFILSGGLEAGR